MDPIEVAVVGAGYWGPNLIRNFGASEHTVVRWVCDVSSVRAEQAAARAPHARATTDLDAVLADTEVDAVAIATPAATHAELAVAALEAGKHVLVEKPLAHTVADGRRMVEAARRNGLTLMCDHTFCYTSAVQQIHESIARGDLGAVHYYDSVRINLGLVQPDIDVFWDLAPHDLSILDYVLPDDIRPVSVSATGADPARLGRTCVGYASLALSNGGVAGLHVNWMSPTKIRTTIIGGSARMIVWDDLNPAQRLSIFDAGIDLAPKDDAERRRNRIAYRRGDMVAPALAEVEALSRVVDEFAASIRERRPPLTDGEAGLRVLETLVAIHESLDQHGAPVALEGVTVR